MVVIPCSLLLYIVDLYSLFKSGMHWLKASLHLVFCYCFLLIFNFLLNFLYTYIVVVNFNQSSYSVAEDDGILVIELMLSNQSSHSFEVLINLMEITATGIIKFYCTHVIMYNYYVEYSFSE